SPHYELPLAGATSFFIHGLVLGILAVGGLAFLFRDSVEASRPPQMEVRPVTEDSAGGFGGTPGLPGEQGRQEMGIGDVGGREEGPETVKDGVEEFPALPTEELQLPPSEEGTEPSDKVLQEFKKLSL